MDLGETVRKILIFCNVPQQGEGPADGAERAGSSGADKEPEGSVVDGDEGVVGPEVVGSS